MLVYFQKYKYLLEPVFLIQNGFPEPICRIFRTLNQKFRSKKLKIRESPGNFEIKLYCECNKVVPIKRDKKTL